MKRVLVTGAGGFIGSHLVEALLAGGYTVRGMHRYTSHNSQGHLTGNKDYEPVFGDIRDRDFVLDATQECDTIFHLAALISVPYSYHTPESQLDVNLRGTFNVLEAARMWADQPRVILTSTSEVYGSARYTPMDESHPLQAQSPYAASKIAADKLGESYYNSYDLEVVTVRPFNTYGPRQSTRAIIPTVLSQLHSGKVTLGNLTPIRDFVYIQDTVRGMITAGVEDKAIGKTINLATGVGVSIANLVWAAAAVVGGNPEPLIGWTPERVRPENSEVKELRGDNRLAKELLNWEPQVPLTSGLVEVDKYLRENTVTQRYI